MEGDRKEMEGWEGGRECIGMFFVHRLSVPRLLENLWRHVPGGSTCRRKHVKGLLVHDPAQSKICNQQIRVVLRRPEQQILGLQVAMNDAMIVEVGNGGEGSADEVGGVGFIV